MSESVPNPAPLDRIGLRDIQCRGIIGIHPHERVKTQELIVNVVLHADTRPAAASDAIGDTVDYHAVALGVEDLVATSEFLLVERLAEEIARLALGDPRVQRVEVDVEKPEAVPFVRTVGVSIVRDRGEFFPTAGDQA